MLFRSAGDLARTELDVPWFSSRHQQGSRERRETAPWTAIPGRALVLSRSERRRGEGEETAAAAGRKSGGRLGFVEAEGGLVVPGGRWRRAPGGGARAIAFRRGRTVTRTKVGPSVREREREERGWAAALRGGRRLGRPVGWPGCLPRWFSFFF